MNLQQWINNATNQLKSAGIASARLDALMLLEDSIGKDRGWLLAHPDMELSDIKLGGLAERIERRIGHEPLAYIRGRSEFYGREFIVSPATLQPRPETETMVGLLLDQVKSGKLKVETIIDVGTGSGAIAITTKLELPKLNVYATEINADALKIAEQNAEKLGAGVLFHQGSLLEPLKYQISDIRYLAVMANLPYVPDSHTINEAAMHEPKVAIFGGRDGLDLYREMFAQLSVISPRNPVIFTESLPFQHEKLSKIAASTGYRLVKTKDLIQVFETASSEERPLA